MRVRLHEEDLRHHSLVFVFQQMAMKERHSGDDGVGEVHDEIDGLAGFEIDGVEPIGSLYRRAVTCVGEEVNLMDVKRVIFMGVIDHFPMLIVADGNSDHGRTLRGVLFSVDVEAEFVFGEGDDEVDLLVLDSGEL